MSRRPKPPVSAWIVRERKRLGLKPHDLAARLSAMGLPVADGTPRTWEAGRSPSAENIEGLERIFGTVAPNEAGDPHGDTVGSSAALIQALQDQTAAINRLVDWLGTLAPQAIADGVADALREAGLSPTDGESPDEPPLGQTG